VAQHTTPARLAEAHGPTHPTVVDRLSKEMCSLAGVLDRCDAPSMAGEDPWSAMEVLTESLERLRDEAELHRPTVV
jgi:hypothetical protein